ncbi:MAG: M3 family metallopeptidase [Alistipes sp.]
MMAKTYARFRIFALIVLCNVSLAVGTAYASNPLSAPSDAPFGAPRFDKIHCSDIGPALQEGMDEYKANIEKIRTLKPEEASFDQVIVALDQADRTLSRVRAISNYLRGNFGTDSIVKITVETTPEISALYDQVNFDPQIFALVKTLYDRRAQLGLDSLQLRVLDKRYKSYVRSGALCTPEQQQRLTEINAEIAVKRMQHGQNIVHENENFQIIVGDVDSLSGVSESTQTKFALHAKKLGYTDKWVIRSGDYGIVMANCTNRGLRERLYKAYITRCNMGNAFDNKQLSVDLINLRLERAKLLGYNTYSDYVLETNMAKTPEKVYELLMPLTRAAIDKGLKERAELEAFATQIEGADFQLKPWDVSYYAGRLRKEVYHANTSAARSYLLFDHVCKGVFHVANKLYGITFTQRKDIPVYNRDVQTYEVRNADGSPLGVLYLDCFARKGKRGGAWCSRLQDYSCAGAVEQLPLVTISCNFARSAADKPQLLGISEVETLFHESGHALASFFARGPYPEVTGNFPRDMVELPSQLLEHWAWEPEVLAVYAHHHKSGEPMPDDLIERMRVADRFEKGLYLTNYYASTLLDLEWHNTDHPIAGCDVDAFEQEFLKRYGFPSYTDFRYRTTYFNHMFASSYASQYYVYTWAAVLDTDVFAAFALTGDVFDQGVANRFRRHILTEIGYDEPMTQYVRFRGELPKPAALMHRFGLTE